MKTPYDVLGVAPGADEKTIATAFREAAKACHPDRNPEDRAAEQQFKQITAARDALKNPEWRALYRYLQFKRQHERRHWILIVASCTLSALVSAGLVSWIEKQSISGPPSEERLPLAASLDVRTGRDPHFELAGTTVPVRTNEGEAAQTAQSPETNAEPREGGDQAHDRRRVLAAFGMAAVPAASTAEAALAEKPQERAHPPKTNKVNTCLTRTGQRAAGSQPASGRCVESPLRSHSNGRPKIQPRTAPVVSQNSKRPRTLLSVLGHAFGAPPSGARSKQGPTRNIRAAQKSQATYAGSNECWINETDERRIPCGPSAGE
jgi:hypothetical protein